MTPEDTPEEFEDFPNIYRECALRFLQTLHYAIELQPDCPAKWGVAFATNNPMCQGRSMSDIAAQIGVSRSAISDAAQKFCRKAGIPRSPYMDDDSPTMGKTTITNR
jgi:hypothetical protein